MTAFPLAMGLAVWLRNRFAFGAVIAVSTFLLVIASYASVNGLRLTP